MTDTITRQQYQEAVAKPKRGALELFRDGYDYIEIAIHFGTTEAVIERGIHKLRLSEKLEKKSAIKRSHTAAAWRERNRDELRAIRKANA